MAQHTVMGGKVHVYKRENSRFWLQLSCRKEPPHEHQGRKPLAGQGFRRRLVSGLARQIETRRTEIRKDLRDAAVQSQREYEIITEGQRSPVYVEGNKTRLRVHLLPYFGDMGLSEITPGTVQEYRIHRHEKAMAERGKPPAHNTMHQEIVTLRQTLKTAYRHGWLKHLPDLSEPYKRARKISHRAWFSPEEYKQLYEVTRRRVRHPKRERYRWECEQLHDYVLFMANTGLRPDEANRLEFRDVAIVDDDATGETILEIEVRGKRGVGYCKSTSGAVRPFERLKARNKPAPTDPVFPKPQRQLFNTILKEEDLKFDRDGQPRTAYSLRHTYICLRLMEGADIYQIAKNCRTSVEMIEKYYASHIKNRLDAAAINIRRARTEKEES